MPMNESSDSSMLCKSQLISHIGTASPSIPRPVLSGITTTTNSTGQFIVCTHPHTPLFPWFCGSNEWNIKTHSCDGTRSHTFVLERTQSKVINVASNGVRYPSLYMSSSWLAACPSIHQLLLVVRSGSEWLLIGDLSGCTFYYPLIVGVHWNLDIENTIKSIEVRAERWRRKYGTNKKNYGYGNRLEVNWIGNQMSLF